MKAQKHDYRLTEKLGWIINLFQYDWKFSKKFVAEN